MRRLLLIIGAVVAVLLIMGGLVYALARNGGIVGSSTTKTTASTAATSYCADLKAQNYTAAYGLFDAALQQAVISQATYQTAAQAEDTDQGKVTACTVGTTTANADKTDAVAATVTRGTTKATLTFTLALESGAWKFTKAPDVTLVPYATVSTYCSDLKTNQDAAWALLSAKAQQVYGSVAAYKSAITSDASILGDFTGCHLQQVTATSVKLSVDFNKTFFQNLPGSATLVAKGTTVADLIDTFSLNLLGLDIGYPVSANGLPGGSGA